MNILGLTRPAFEALAGRGGRSRALGRVYRRAFAEGRFEPGSEAIARETAAALAARVTPSGEVGVLRGTGQAASFELLDPVGRMAAGDLIVTIGTADGVLPADLPVGRVSTVRGSAADLSRVAAVQPGVDASTLDRVVVLVPEGGP